jgi:two-component system nitrate/nitrite sensor histidine kinase NarX
MTTRDTPASFPGDPSADDRVADAVANERIRVATELRDGTLQALTGLSLQLTGAVRGAGADADHMLGVIAQVEQTLEDELRSLRLFVLELMEEAEDSSRAPSVVTELSAMIERVHRVWGLPATLGVGALVPLESSRLVREVVRLAQEALVNAARYAHAASATVQISGNAETVRLTVEQTGRGFAFHGSLEHDDLFASRRGPVALKLRVRALGGRLRIHSSADRAAVEIEVPTGVRA